MVVRISSAYCQQEPSQYSLTSLIYVAVAKHEIFFNKGF